MPWLQKGFEVMGSDPADRGPRTELLQNLCIRKDLERKT